MTSRGVRKRYHDMYDTVYHRRPQTSLRDIARQLIREFEASPSDNVRIPRYVHTLFQTQSIAVDERAITVPTLAPGLALSEFIYRRAARRIVNACLVHLYRPYGWFFCKRLTRLTF